jgi:asparagine synthase (glutamine-hydrolysing)
VCGVAGLIDLRGRGVQEDTLRAMTDAIAHRGPDGEGQWLEGNVGIGHRRLAIIDLSAAGHQPMISSDSRYVLSFNGEIYNFKEIRVELISRGYGFRSESDTEVVLSAFAEWGTKAFLRFNGMFALAIWDRKNRILTLARDRYGVKPIYFSQQGGVFSFGSEQKAILAQESFKRVLDKEALVEYFTFQNILTNRTLLKDVNILPAGHFAQLNANDAVPKLKQTRYWDFHFHEPDRSVDRKEHTEELERLFIQGVKRQLVSDVELGSYLSGGMDSGSITAVASRSIPELKSFTCGFDLSSASGLELAFDERAKAEAMSAKFKTEHYEIILKSGDMERSLPALSRHLEEPRVGQSYPNFYAAKLASKFVKVVLSGAGGDELFGGYPWRYYRATGSQSFDEYIDSYYTYWQRLTSNSELQSLMKPIWRDVSEVSTKDIFRDVYSSHQSPLERPEDYINHSLYFEAKTFLHGLFVVEDKLSMAHGLESRVPFMDNDLVDFAMTCPVNLKINKMDEVIRMNENASGNKSESYFNRTRDGKQILRDAMKNIIPSEVTEATKQGFSSPDSSWFKGESNDFVRNRLSADSAISSLLDHDQISGILESHMSGTENRRLLIWGLLNVNEWLTQIDQAGQNGLPGLKTGLTWPSGPGNCP